MSVAAQQQQQHSPYAPVGSKRQYFEGEENADHLQRLDGAAAAAAYQKRFRLRGSPAAAGRYSYSGGTGGGGPLHEPPPSAAAYAVAHAAIVSALRGLFPEMSDKVCVQACAACASGQLGGTVL